MSVWRHTVNVIVRDVGVNPEKSKKPAFLSFWIVVFRTDVGAVTDVELCIYSSWNMSGLHPSSLVRRQESN